MGPVAITLTTDLYEVRSALNSTDFSGGPAAPIGQCIAIPPNASDITLAYVRPIGHAAEGDSVFSGGTPYSSVVAELTAAVPTLERVYLPANSGGQVWMYIRASGNILRGNPVSIDVSDFATLGITMEVAATGAGSPGVVKGVAQWNIDDDQYGWVLVSGVGKVRSNAAFSIGDRLTVVGTAGEVDTVNAATDMSFAVALEAAGAGDLHKWADINCIA